MLALGRHVSIAGSIDMAFDRASALNCTAMQIFVTNPRGWSMSGIDRESEAAYRKKASLTGIKSIAHMPYLPNIASSNSDIFSKSVESLWRNMARCESLGIDYLVTHMGSHMGKGKDKGLENVVAAVKSALDASRKTHILLENEAGHMNSVGESMDDLAKVVEQVGDKRLGFCLDTCHMFAAGYDIRKHDVLDEMFSVVGIEKVHAIHVNDAKKELGSHLDRHANIGFGCIGTEGFRSLLNYKGIKSKILVLETPLGPQIGEAEEIALVKSLIF